MIIYPEKTYVVQDGDTLESISAAFNVTLKQLLRNNPQLSDMSILVPEEELVISYANTGKKKVKVNGFVNAFINLSVLKKTLQYLTYITILNFRVTDDGNIIDINDADIVKAAYEFGVAPLMFLSTFNEYGTGGYGILHSILYNSELQDALIHNTLNLLKAKGYYGLYIGFEQILHQDLQQYSDFINNITSHFKDAKTIDTIMNMVTDHGIAGVALWNIMYYYPPTFLVINTQYEIESVLDQ